jgi:hypothetical protein
LFRSGGIYILSFILELLQYGAIVFILKFTVDRVLSTDIEIELENNYSRAFREIFNWLLFLAFFIFIIFIVYLNYESNNIENSRIDIVTSAHKSLTKKEYIDYLERIKIRNQETNKRLLIIMVVTLLLMVTFFYVIFRKLWYNEYKRRVYIDFRYKKYILLKKIDKERILFGNEHQSNYIILSFDDLKDTTFYKESISERKKRRGLTYYKMISERIRFKDFNLFTKIVLMVLILFIFLMLVISYLQSGFIVIFAIILTISVWGIYTFVQYKNGKKIKFKPKRKKSKKSEKSLKKNKNT